MSAEPEIVAKLHVVARGDDPLETCHVDYGYADEPTDEQVAGVENDGVKAVAAMFEKAFGHPPVGTFVYGSWESP